MIEKKSTFAWIAVILFCMTVVHFSCKKEDDFITGPDVRLVFSTDTLIFDTVFTTIGSTTRALTIYNKHDKKIRINEIRLAGGDASPYRLNIDGSPAIQATDIDLESGDSLYIFVRATIDPTNQNSPLIVKDSILFNTAGNYQDIDLVSWGQDAHYIVGNQYIQGFLYFIRVIAGENQTVTWTNDKPYVVYGYAVVDSSGNLKIEQGTKIHFHKNSGLWIYRGGNLNVTGTAESPVIFQGDRLEEEYDDMPGQWDRIWINEGTQNSIKNAIIKNAFIGIQAEVIDLENPLPRSLTLENTVIKNMGLWGLFTLAYPVTAGNCLIADCGQNTAFLSTGGVFDFRQCTFANYYQQAIRNEPSFTLSNYIIVYDFQGNPLKILGDLESAYFGNCVFYGNLDEEILLAKDEAAAFNYKFENCVFQSELDISDPQYFSSCMKKINPVFKDPYEGDFEPDSLSVMLDMGSLQVITGSPMNLQYDLNNQLRTADAGPDPGAYEFIPGGKKK